MATETFKMVSGKEYTITKTIKIHTKPFRYATIPQVGIFVRETQKYYCFRGFRVRKDCCVHIKEEIE